MRRFLLGLWLLFLAAPARAEDALRTNPEFYDTTDFIVIVNVDGNVVWAPIQDQKPVRGPAGIVPVLHTQLTGIAPAPRGPFAVPREGGHLALAQQMYAASLTAEQRKELENSDDAFPFEKYAGMTGMTVRVFRPRTGKNAGQLTVAILAFDSLTLNSRIWRAWGSRTAPPDDQLRYTTLVAAAFNSSCSGHLEMFNPK